MKVGILGASGQLGRKTLEALIAGGVRPRDIAAIARHPGKLANWAERGVDVRAGDYDVRDMLVTSFREIDRLLLIPSLAMPAARAQQYDNAISAAREAGVPHLIHYGILGTSIEMPFLVAPFLLYAESALRTSGMAWTILRNSVYADPVADWIPDIVRRGTIPYPTGEARCSYVTRDDIARAGAAVLAGKGHEGKTYRLTGPKALSTGDLCDIVSRVTGKPISKQHASDADYLESCRQGGVPEPFARLLLSLYWAFREGFFEEVTKDIEHLTGDAPESFERYLERRRGSGAPG